MEIRDRRVRRTHHSLANALIALTLQKGYEAVTIRDITEYADVGYTTFFRHYHDKDALLKEILDVVLAELLELLCPPEIGKVDPTTVGVLLFRYVQEHTEVVRVLLGSHALRQHLIQIATLSTISRNNAQPDSSIPLEVAAHHIVASTIGLIEWWLDHEMPYPPTKMGQIYEALIARPTSQLAFQEQA